MPTDAWRTEVALRRLLHCCEEQAQRCAGSAPDAEWCSTPQARHAVDTAMQYATELAAAGAPADALAAYRKRTEALAAALRPAPRPAYLRAPAAAELRRRAAAPPSAETAAVLRRHAALQEDLSDELVDMASGLKRNALAMESGLRESMRVLDAVESVVEHNVGAASRAATRAEELHAVNRAGCWQTCVVLTLVTLVFCWTLVLIRSSKDRLAAAALRL